MRNNGNGMHINYTRWMLIMTAVVLILVACFTLYAFAPNINHFYIMRSEFPQAAQEEIDRVCGENYDTVERKNISSDRRPEYQSPRAECALTDTFPVSVRCECLK